jgi:predicted PurR-regulated permease PerM
MQAFPWDGKTGGTLLYGYLLHGFRYDRHFFADYQDDDFKSFFSANFPAGLWVPHDNPLICPENSRTMKFNSPWIIVTITLVVLGMIVYKFSDVFIYVIISWILAMLGQPVMDFFRHKLKFNRWKFGEALGSLLTLFLFIGIIVLILILFVPLIIQQANNFAGIDYHQIYDSLQEPIDHFNQWLSELGISQGEGISPKAFQTSLAGYFNISELGNFFSSLFSFAGKFFIGIFSIFFITFFFLQDNTMFTDVIIALVPDRFVDQTNEVINDIRVMLRRYFFGILIQVTTITVLVSTALALLGIENALLIGFFAAIINVIPYIGPIIGATFGIILTISSNLDVDFYSVMLPMIITVAAVFAGMQLIDNFILQPFIYGTSARAHPLEIFIVILVAAELGGIPGMVLAIPAYIVIRVIARAFLYRFKIVQKLTGGMNV